MKIKNGSVDIETKVASEQLLLGQGPTYFYKHEY